MHTYFFPVAQPLPQIRKKACLRDPISVHSQYRYSLCANQLKTQSVSLYCTHTQHTVSFRQGLGESCLSKTESLRPIQYSTVQCNAQAFSRSISLTEMTSG